MNITYTEHAILRMKERKIYKKEIEEVMDKSRKEHHRGIATIREYKNICVVFIEGDLPDESKVIKILTVYRPDRSLDYKINNIPAPHEWWKQEDKKVFINEAHHLIDKGLTEAEVIEHLTEVYRAVCGEFGE